MTKAEIKEKIKILLDITCHLAPSDQRELLEEVNQDTGERIAKINNFDAGKFFDGL